jgi:uroporphyrinogen III methyltransferase/synthase
VEVDAYDATLASPDPTVVRRAGRVDYVVFTSASAARNLRTILPHEDFERLQSSAGAFCIGPVAAEAAREIGFHVVTVAEQHTVPGLVHALEEATAHG